MQRPDGGSELLSQYCLNEDTRKRAIDSKFQSQFTIKRQEDYQFVTFKDMIAANKEKEREHVQRNERGGVKRFFSKVKRWIKGNGQDGEESKSARSNHGPSSKTSGLAASHNGGAGSDLHQFRNGSSKKSVS